MNRSAAVNRETKETNIKLSIDLNGGEINVKTGIGFFDHMLISFATHLAVGLTVDVKGDLYVDCHHTIEDTGIVLGMAFKKALGNTPIKRFGSAYIPMDESLSFVSLDISARPYLVFDADFPQEKVGELDTCMAKEFFTAFAFNAGITLHMKTLYGLNSHHMIESLFKALAYALKDAIQIKDDGVLMSTKGVLV